jgi:hypothetical protein
MAAAGQGATAVTFVSGAFFDRYLAQMANNGGVWAEPWVCNPSK